MLRQILKLLEEQKYMSLKSIQLALKMNISSVEDMLEILIKKEKIKELNQDYTNRKCYINAKYCKVCPLVTDKSLKRIFTLNINNYLE